jgi:hypothetical protein
MKYSAVLLMIVLYCIVVFISFYYLFFPFLLSFFSLLFSFHFFFLTLFAFSAPVSERDAKQKAMWKVYTNNWTAYYSKKVWSTTSEPCSNGT